MGSISEAFSLQVADKNFHGNDIIDDASFSFESLVYYNCSRKHVYEDDASSDNFKEVFAVNNVGKEIGRFRSSGSLDVDIGSGVIYVHNKKSCCLIISVYSYLDTRVHLSKWLNVAMVNLMAFEFRNRTKEGLDVVGDDLVTVGLKKRVLVDLVGARPCVVPVKHHVDAVSIYTWMWLNRELV